MHPGGDGPAANGPVPSLRPTARSAGFTRPGSARGPQATAQLGTLNETTHRPAGVRVGAEGSPGDGSSAAQLCHAPQVLAAAGTLQGRRTAAYPALAPDLTAAGAEFVDGATVIDGQMVPARAWPDHPPWMHEFIGILRAKSPA